MSNTSTVTPYAAATAGTVVLVGGAIAFGRWLADETAADREAVDRLTEERRQERLDGLSPRCTLTPCEGLTIASVNLHLRDPESLVRSAQKLGYRVEPLASSSMAPLSCPPPILLRSPAGERLVVTATSGGVSLHAVGDGQRQQRLIRQHTLDRAVEHLESKGLALKTAVLPNGEVQILAREQGRPRRGGKAEIRAQVRKDGRVDVDISCVQGNRCEEIVSDMAEAVGGRVSSMTKKASACQLPGEPARARVKV